MIEGADPSDGVKECPCSTISPAVMDKVIVFLEHHANNPLADIPRPITTNVIKDIVGEWDADFVDVDHRVLMPLILAANFLHCQPLMSLGMLKVACMVKDKEPDEVREMFGIDVDISPEEEKAIREANPWVFDLKSQHRAAAAQESEEEEEEED